MAPKGGTFFFLLIVACAALEPSHGMPEYKRDLRDMAKKMMRNCRNKGYPVPNMMMLKTIFNNSDLPVADRNSDQSNTLLSTFLKVLNMVSPDERKKDPVNNMTNKMQTFNILPTMIKLMRNSSEASACCIQALVAPLCWMCLTNQNTESEINMTSDDYNALLLAVRPVLQNMPRLNLPTSVEKKQHLKKIMEVLKKLHGAMSKDQRVQTVKWAKEQINQKYFNCTTRPPSDSRSMRMKPCKSSLKWLSLDVLKLMGPQISNLASRDVESSSQEQLCEFFRSAHFKSATSMTTKMNPSLAKMFLQKFQECFSGKEELAENVDKLGILACHYSTAPAFLLQSPQLSSKLLSELNNCDDGSNPKIIQLKKRLVKSVMSNANGTEVFHKLGRSLPLLSPKQLSEIPVNDLKELVKSLGPSIRWTVVQSLTLVKKLLGDKCTVSGKELIVLQSFAESFPICVLKHGKELLNDEEGLNKMSEQLRKWQRMALLQEMLKDMAPSELVRVLSGPLLLSISLNKLDEANITSLDKVADKTWSVSQAAFLAKKMHDAKKLYWRLRSVLQGVTCRMIDEVADSDTLDMAQAITETPQWLPKVQARCAARKFFASLEKERADYFKTITEEEMDNIPTVLLIHLPPSKVKDLPDSVCTVFLQKMEEAQPNILPRRSPTLPALTQKALLCLTKLQETDLSGLTDNDVGRLGPLLCELQPAQLRSMAPDVLNSSLQAMASCQHIPQRHRAGIVQLVTQTFGDPFDWSAETMEALGPLLFLDDNAISALPSKPWMTDILFYLMSGPYHNSDALRKKYFDLITTTSNATSKEERTTSKNKEITVESIETLGMSNAYWPAEQLDQIPNEVFLTTLETLGGVPHYSKDQLDVLSRKANKILGPVSQMTVEEVMQMRCIIPGFSNEDLEKLPFSLDTLENIDNCPWNESQMESVWKGVAKYNKLTAQQLTAIEIVALSRFICGLNSSEIGQLNLEAFREAVGLMGGVQCSYKVTQQLKNLAVSAFGNPRNWTEAQVSALGNIIAGLNAADLASLKESVFPFIRPSCIQHILHLAALSDAQLEALGPDNAAMVTNEQRVALSKKQLAALERAETGSQSQETSMSGAPSLTVEGISAFLKPLLFLLMGFLLL